MKLFELKYIGDIISKSKLGKELENKLSPIEKLEKKKRDKTMAATISENEIGTDFKQFKDWANGAPVSKEQLKKFIDDLAKDGKARGQTRNSILDDLMSPLTIDELYAVIKFGNDELTKASKLELSHRGTAVKR